MGSPIEYCCPKCKSPFGRISADSYFCKNCSIAYPVIAGIPDFRLLGPPYGSREEEEIKVKNLLQNYRDMNYMELAGFSIGKYSESPPLLKRKYIKYRLTMAERGRKRIASIESMFHLLGFNLDSTKRALDLGCGTGSSIAGMISVFEQIVGLDIALDELILAKKYFEENSIPNVQLVCGNSEDLPFCDGSFDFVNANDVIEHLSDQMRGLQETKKVLGLGGVLHFNSANRFQIFTPEPHVQLRGVGFLPRFLMNGYVRLRKRSASYEKIRLLSYFELSRMLEKVYPKFYMEPVALSPVSVKGKLYASLVNMTNGGLHRLLQKEHVVLAQKISE